MQNGRFYNVVQASLRRQTGICGAFSAQNGRVCDAFAVQDVFATCLRYIFGAKPGVFRVFLWHRVCLCALLRRKTSAFVMSFRRVCGLKRVLVVLFRCKTDVFATCLPYIFSAKRGVFRIYRKTERFCNVFRACLRR